MNLKKGVSWALMTAGLSGVAILFNRFVVKAVGDPLVFTTVKNLGVAGVMLVVLAKKTRAGKIKWKKLRKQDWIKLGLIGVIGGSLPFYLFFKGLLVAESAKAALIHKSLIIWVAILAVPILKEKISAKQMGALGLILASNLVIGGIGQWSWGRGETMILMATVLWSIENVVAKKALKRVEADVVAGARMIIGSLLLLIATLMTGKMNLIFKLNFGQWALTVVTIGLLTGYVMSWYRALKLAPVTLVATVLSLGSVVTNILSSVFITHKLSLGLLYQISLLAAGVWFFVMEVKKNARLTQVRTICL